MKNKRKTKIGVVVAIIVWVIVIIVWIATPRLLSIHKCKQISKTQQFDCEMKCESNQMEFRGYTGTCQKIDCYCIDKNGKTIKEVIEYPI